MPVLWSKAGDESLLPPLLSKIEGDRLLGLFASAKADSPWSLAARRLGLSFGPAPILRLVQGVPYFNSSALAEAVSAGTLHPEPGESGKIIYKKSWNPVAYLRLLLLQWRLECFLSATRCASPLTNDQEKIVESLSLGLALQALLLRLPLARPSDLARWLANPEEAPAYSRKTVARISLIQLRRTSLSPAWQGIFESAGTRVSPPDLPDFFWDEPSPINPQSEQAISAEAQLWRGIPICPGVVEGKLVPVIGNALPPASLGSSILLFRNARPESTEHFTQATALAYAEGGALAHACCVAREQGIPCVSGLGKAFWQAAMDWQKNGQEAQVRLNGANGEVQLIALKSLS